MFLTGGINYFPRLIVVTGHYGSGKTTVAVNLAYTLADQGKRVSIVDMDIVNPYFRMADARGALEEKGVRCVVPQYANTNVDIPALPAEISSLFRLHEAEYVIFDVGGDDGAAALSSYREYFYREPYEMIYVCSMYRPLTSNPAEAASLLSQIELKSGLKGTSIVNNSSLGDETTAELIGASEEYAKQVCKLTGLPLKFTSAFYETNYSGENIFYMRNYTRKYYKQER